MEVRTLTKSNLSDYAGIVDPSAAENIGRDHYRGFALHDDLTGETYAGMIWKLRDIDRKERRSEIKWFFATDSDYCRWLFREFETQAEQEKVVSVALELTPGDEMSEEVMDRLNYNTYLSESKLLYVSVGRCSKAIREKGRDADRIRPLSALSLKQFNKGISLLKGKKHPGSYGAEDFDNLSMYWYDPDISCALLGEDGRPKGMLLMHETCLGTLKVELFFAEGKDARANLVEMMSYCARALNEKFPPEKIVEIDREGESARAITERLFPLIHGREVLRAVKEF